MGQIHYYGICQTSSYDWLMLDFGSFAANPATVKKPDGESVGESRFEVYSRELILW